MDSNRTIVGSVIQSGRIYKAGDEAALAHVLPRKDTERLVAKGVLAGDWGTGDVVEPAPAPSRTRVQSAEEPTGANVAPVNEPDASAPATAPPAPKAERAAKAAKASAPKPPKEPKAAKTPKPPKSSPHTEK